MSIRRPSPPSAIPQRSILLAARHPEALYELMAYERIRQWEEEFDELERHIRSRCKDPLERKLLMEPICFFRDHMGFIKHQIREMHWLRGSKWREAKVELEEHIAEQQAELDFLEHYHPAGG